MFTIKMTHEFDRGRQARLIERIKTRNKEDKRVSVKKEEKKNADS